MAEAEGEERALKNAGSRRSAASVVGDDGRVSTVNCTGVWREGRRP
jgi:hypothetical protein